MVTVREGNKRTQGQPVGVVVVKFELLELGANSYPVKYMILLAPTHSLHGRGKRPYCQSPDIVKAVLYAHAKFGSW